MALQVIDKEVNVAVIGLTNSGKSTFITSMIDKERFGNVELLHKLCDNDGGLTKVTTFYALTDCDSVSVNDVVFHDGIVEEKNKITVEILKKLKIHIPASTDDNEKTALNGALEQFRNRLKNDLEYTVRTINAKEAEKVIRYVKILVPATSDALELMKKHGFETVVLRDTRGFLDESNADKKSPNLADNGLDGIQACILMNGQNSPMPSLARDMYGDFVKSIFEAVPTFIIERNAVLGFGLKNGIDDTIKKYDELSNNPDISGLNFIEVNKFLQHLGIVDENGEATNQLIKANKRQHLMPEVIISKDEDKKVYSSCSMIVFGRLLNSLDDFRELLKRIINFFDIKANVTGFQNKFLETFQNIHFSDIVTDFSNGDRNKSVYVRPIPNDFDMADLLDRLIKEDLLGPRGGITTKHGGYYTYGHTGIFAVAAWKALNEIIVGFNVSDEYPQLANVIVQALNVEERSNTNIVNTFILEVKRCLKYVLLNSCTDCWATFSGYYFISRNIVVDAVDETKKQWKGYESRFGSQAIDTVYLTNVEALLKKEMLENNVNWARASQLFTAFRYVIAAYFSCVSTNHNYLNTNTEVKV